MTTLSACPACAAAPLAERVAAPRVAQPDIILSLPTIHCAGCIAGVERSLRTLPGVKAARVNLSLKRVNVQTETLTDAQLVTRLRDAGFEAHPLDRSVLDTGKDAEGQRLLVKLAVAGFAMMNVMLFSVAIWSGASDSTRELFHMISAAISLPAVLFCGQPFFANAWSALRVRRLNMDVPISLAILLAAGMSLYEVLNHGHHAYFDAALSLTFFLLVGRYLDHRSRRAAHSAARDLAALEVHSALRLTKDSAQSVPVSDLRVGDLVLIPTGVRVPVDGTLISLEATTDRAFLTGESAAVRSLMGAEVQAGEINLGAPFKVQATAVGADTTLRRVAAMVEMAENSRNSYTALADRAAAIYAPAVHLLALFAFIGWAVIGGDIRQALNVAVAVLIITCPCALGLAVPAVSTAAIARLYGKGFLVKSGTALERLAETDTVMFDKTGTLTVPASKAVADLLTPRQQAVARALAQSSTHPVSRAVLAALPAGEPATLSGIVEVAGRGVEGLGTEGLVQLGSGAWLGAEFEGPGLRIGCAPAIALPLTETLRAGAQTAIDGLRAQGLHPGIISGDRASAVTPLADTLGVADHRSGITATEKHTQLQTLAKQGHRVMMVGDGLNDAAALAAAHASVAPSSALDAARNAADIVILNDSLADLPLLMSVARAATRLSKQNFAIAALYNVIAVPVALAGMATPLLAAIAMSVSSITVLANAMRIRRVK
ncbi:heavy metal translocating P-type ATPase [Pseudosulfitobacter koreensis]|uniref:Heavy metal translocating P-type ATPase n=1 Tax=Pseudosulfitobacter koreensis TaxID=2968472 RepID=A0ABT1Z0P4_9RHOB|nr:heavy metal translocating P-type ATPase [Pseudosulfitobacter koreense]MCR8826714.1 heavy metal translocating P-type ATPase [Pseudosulfitobacter koreense]